MLKVYGRANSINVRKVLWMLDEVGVKYEREDWGRGFRPTDDPEFRKINPVGVVPVIDDGDFRLRESNTIVRYLADKHGRADLYPKDLQDACHHRVLDGLGLDRLRQRHAPGISRAGRQEPGLCRQGRERRQGMGRADAACSTQHLAANGPYVMGSTFTIGDIPVGLVVNRWFSIAFQKPEFKAVSAYYDRLALAAALQGAWPQRHTLS